MKDIVERAAIALYTHQAWAMGQYGVWQSLNQDVKAAYRAWARDVLYGSREPTEAMVQSGAGIAVFHKNIPIEAKPAAASSVWNAMLMAGLAESDALNPPKVNGNAQRRPKLVS